MGTSQGASPGVCSGAIKMLGLGHHRAAYDGFQQGQAEPQPFLRHVSHCSQNLLAPAGNTPHIPTFPCTGSSYGLGYFWVMRWPARNILLGFLLKLLLQLPNLGFQG